MITFLLPCRSARAAATSLSSLLPQLAAGEQVLLAGLEQTPGLAERLAALVDRFAPAPLCVLGGRSSLREALNSPFSVVLNPPARLRPGGLAHLRSALEAYPRAAWIRIPPSGAEPDFRLAQRRLFGVPLRIAFSDPLVLSRTVLRELPRRGLLAALAGRADRLWLAMERAEQGHWLAAPLLEPDEEIRKPGPSPARVQRLLGSWIRERTLEVSAGIRADAVRVTADRPRGIDIELTNRCNAGCRFCPRHEMPGLGDMSDEVFDRVLAFVREQPIGSIYFIGRGEPMLHPRFLDYIERIKQTTGLEVEVFTNGLPLRSEVVDRLAALNDPELNLAINVSLHSLRAETHQRLTGTSLEVISRNLDHLVRQRDRLRVSYAFVTNRVNEREMAALRRHLDATGNTAWDISLVYNKGGFVPEGELFDDAFFRRQANWDPARAESPTGPCWYSYSGQFYWVNYRGEFTLCHDDFREDTILGRVGQTSLEEVDQRVAALLLRGGAARCHQCNKRLREWHHGENRDTISAVKAHFEACGEKEPG